MATRIADAALRIRATGTEDARRAILRLDGAVKNVGGSVQRTTAAMGPLRNRVDLLIQATQQESTRVAALAKLQGVEQGLTRTLERNNLTIAQRVKLEEQLRRVQSTLRPALPAASFGARDTTAAARRISLLIEGTRIDGTRAASMAKLAGVENTLTRTLERGNLTIAQRIAAERELARVRATLRPPPVTATPTAFGRADGGTAAARRIAQLAEGVKLEATRADSLRKLAGVESGLSAALGRGNLTLQQRIALEGQLVRVQTIRASVAPKVEAASFGVAGTTAASRRIGLLAEGLKLEGTRAVSLTKLAGVESGLTRALQRGNLTLEQRILLEGQLARVRALRAPPVPPPAQTPGALFANAKGALGFLGLTVGASAAISAINGVWAASDRAETAQRKLEAASKLSGVALGTVAGIAKDAQIKLGLTSTAAADLTQATVKLTGRANAVNKSGEFMARWLDLAAAQGLSLDDALQALTTTLIGQDEGLNRLGLANPQQIYEKWARAAGTTAAKMGDAEKTQAIINEVIETGGKVTGEYEKRLKTTAGQQEQFANQLERTKASLGGLLSPTREAGTSILTNLVAPIALAIEKLDEWDKKKGRLGGQGFAAGLVQSLPGGALLSVLAEKGPDAVRRQGPPVSGKGGGLAPVQVAANMTKEQLDILDKEIATLTKLRDLHRLSAGDRERLTAIEQQLTSELKVGGIATERRAQLEGMLADVRGKSKKETKTATEALADEAAKLLELNALHAITGDQLSRAIAIEADLTTKVRGGTLAIDDRIRAERALQELRAAGLGPMGVGDLTRGTPDHERPKPAERIEVPVDVRPKPTVDTSAFDEATATIKDSLTSTIVDGISGGFAAAVQSGSIADGFKALGAGFLSGLGGLLIMIGKNALAAMTFLDGISKAIAAFAPAVGIPLAIGLIALGGMMQGAGGRVGGGGGARGGRASGGSFAGSRSLAIAPIGITLDPDRRLHEAVTPQNKVQPLPTQQPATPAAPFSPTYIVLGEPTPATQRWVANNTKGAERRSIPTVTRTR